jgi:hypothetical protein
MKFNQYLILGLVLLAAACSSDQEPKIYGSFFVRYMEQGRQIKAHANFYEGDTLATARPKTWTGGVAFLGSSMDARDLQGSGIRYVAERQMDFLSKCVFRFTDEKGKMQEVRMDACSMSQAEFKQPASKQAGLIFSYSGEKLKAGESIVFLLTDEQNQTKTLQFQGPQSSNEIVLTTDMAASVPLGKLQAYAVRTRKTELKQGRFDYLLESEYYTKATAIEVNP